MRLRFTHLVNASIKTKATGFLLKLTLTLWLVAFSSTAQVAGGKTENVFLIVSDGLRWQEIFNGAEEDLLNKENGGVRNAAALRTQFWRDNIEARRQTLFPFLWSEISRHGQIMGNQNKGSTVTVRNPFKFSYPGYNEMLTGFADPLVNSNGKKLNQNVTVFEWLNAKAEFRGRVGVVATWEDFPYIFNCERSKLPIWPAWENRFSQSEIPISTNLTQLLHDTTSLWPDLVYDSFGFHAAANYVKNEHPRFLFLGFGETDEWAHESRYDLYLSAAHQFDDFVKRLWEMVQAIPQYHDKTTFILTADHGRGNGLVEWKNHGESTIGAEGIWMAFIGPDIAPLGERTNIAPATQAQLASTMAGLVGQDFRASFPQAEPQLTNIATRVAH